MLNVIYYFVYGCGKMKYEIIVWNLNFRFSVFMKSVVCLCIFLNIKFFFLLLNCVMLMERYNLCDYNVVWLNIMSWYFDFLFLFFLIKNNSYVK